MADLIAAPATRAGTAAISVVRLSGAGAIQAAEQVFLPRSGTPLSHSPDRKLVLGTLLDKAGEALDHCLCTISRGPGSYTGEDTAELQCHGSPVVIAEALEALYQAGARPALPGEFTQRAFLNGKLDLAQAEAVIDLIESETAEAAKHALGQLGGAVTRQVDGVLHSLTSMAAHFHAAVDWPEEEIEPFELAAYGETLRQAEATLSRLLGSFEAGKVLRKGAACVLLGKPNAGKSSLLNALAGFERVIVTPEAGTTRDTVEETLKVGHVLLRMTDTAGLRETCQAAEQLGVERALAAAEAADVVLAVFDGSGPMEEEDRRVLTAAKAAAKVIPLINKADLPQRLDVSEIEQTLGPAVTLSAKSGEGIENLKTRITALFPREAGTPRGELLTNARHAQAVKTALSGIRQASQAAELGMTPDAVLVGLEGAMEELGRITGATVSTDVAQEIFSRFCVGK